jgi:hypothetical protein
MPCSVVVGHQCFRGPCCFHLQGEVAGIRVSHINTDSQSGLVLSPYLGLRPFFCFITESFGLLCHEAPSLMGGRVCRLKGHNPYLCRKHVCIFFFSFSSFVCVCVCTQINNFVFSKFLYTCQACQFGHNAADYS